MKISFSKNFRSLTKEEVMHTIASNDYVPLVIIPNLGTINEDFEFDIRDVFFIPAHTIKPFERGLDRKHVTVFPPSDYSDVILIDKDYGEYLWKNYSRYNPDEKYQNVYKVLNFSVIFKVLSPFMVNKINIIIDNERNALDKTVQTITHYSNYNTHIK